MPQSEIWHIEQVRRRGMSSTAVVAEKFIAVHIVNITKFGKLILVKSLNVVPSGDYERSILSFAASGGPQVPGSYSCTGVFDPKTG